MGAIVLMIGTIQTNRGRFGSYTLNSFRARRMVAAVEVGQGTKSLRDSPLRRLSTSARKNRQLLSDWTACRFVVVYKQRGFVKQAVDGLDIRVAGCAQPDSANHLEGPQIALAAMFTVSASKAALKRKAMMLCASTVRRIDFDETVTSDTCAHIPIVNEK